MSKHKRIFAKGGYSLRHYQNNSSIVSGLNTLGDYISLAAAANPTTSATLTVPKKEVEAAAVNQQTTLTPTVTFDLSQPVEVLNEVPPLEKSDNSSVTKKSTTKTSSVKGSTGSKFVQDIYKSYYNAVRPNAASDADAQRQALYLTQKAAFETGYGQHLANTHNYGGHRTSKGWLPFKSMDDFAKRDVQLLDKKWSNWRKAKSHKDFVTSITTNNGYGVYAPRSEYNGYFGLTNRVNKYMNRKLKYGGRTDRPKAWIGALIGAATSIAGSLINSHNQEKQLREQRALEREKLVRDNAIAQSQQLLLNQNAQKAYEQQFRMPYRLGGPKRFRETRKHDGYNYVGIHEPGLTGKNYGRYIKDNDTIYVQSSPNPLKLFEIGAKRVGNQPATNEYLRLQKDFNTANEDAIDSNNVGWDLTKEFFRNIGRRLGLKNGGKIRVTDGGIDYYIGDGLHQVVGRSHEQGGVGYRVNGEEIELENGEVWDKQGDSMRVFSDTIGINGKSFADLAKEGYNKNDLFKLQQRMNGDSNGTYRLGGRKKFLIGGDNDELKYVGTDRKTGKKVAVYKSGRKVVVSDEEATKLKKQLFGISERTPNAQEVRNQQAVDERQRREEAARINSFPYRDVTSPSTYSLAIQGFVPGTNYSSQKVAPKNTVQQKETVDTSAPATTFSTTSTPTTSGRNSSGRSRSHIVFPRRNNVITRGIYPSVTDPYPYVKDIPDSWYTQQYDNSTNWLRNNRYSQRAGDLLGQLNAHAYGPIGTNFISMDDFVGSRDGSTPGLIHDNRLGPAHQAVEAFNNSPEGYIYNNILWPREYPSNDYPKDFTEIPVVNGWGEFANYAPRTPQGVKPDGMGVVDTRGVTTVSKDDLSNLQDKINASGRTSADRRNNLGMDLTTGDWIGLGANILGGGLSWLINRNSLRNLRDPYRPIPVQAGKLVTNFDITPQLAVNERMRQAGLDDTERNTSSSVANLDRRNLTNLNYATNAGALWSDKFNREVALLNEDTKNQQTVAMQNAAIYNDYLTRLNEIQNQRGQLRSENDIALIQGLGDAVNRFIAQGQQRYEDNNALRAYIASSHAGTAEKLAMAGVDLGNRNIDAAKRMADYDVDYYTKTGNEEALKAAKQRQEFWNVYAPVKRKRTRRFSLYS